MGPREKLRELLAEPPRSADTFAVLFDLLEEYAVESGWDPSLVECATRYMLPLNTDQQGEPVTVVPREVWARLLGELAKSDYPLAVERMNLIKLASRDYHSLTLWIDAVNTAHCTRQPRSKWPESTTWQEKLDFQKMGAATGEESNGLGPWNVIDGQGRSTKRLWTIDFPPEWMDHELQREFGYTAQFKTVWYADGGNFGPAFDDTLRDDEGLWRHVRRFAAGNEVECPYMHSSDGGAVSLDETWCGEYPGLKCALCEEDLGDDHGLIYLGEMGGAVFMLDVMATVTDIELREHEGDRWEAIAFAGEEEVSVPLVDQHTGLWDSLAAAQEFVRALPGPPEIRVHVIRLEGDEE